MYKHMILLFLEIIHFSVTILINMLKQNKQDLIQD